MGADVARVVAALLPATDPERVTAALEAFDEAVVGQDHGGRFAFWNASAQRAAGQPRRGPFPAAPGETRAGGWFARPAPLLPASGAAGHAGPRHPAPGSR